MNDFPDNKARKLQEDCKHTREEALVACRKWQESTSSGQTDYEIDIRLYSYNTAWNVYQDANFRLFEYEAQQGE